MAVANPITSKVQTIAMHRDGAYWKLEQKPDLITCDDPFFRPVGLTNGPDGCIYIVDWYNKIISHNEVPRAHPDRDKTRGRIWRVKPVGARTSESAALRQRPAAPPLSKVSATPETESGARPPAAGSEARAPQAIPDFTKLSADELIAMLGKEPVAKAHLAWQTLADQHTESQTEQLAELARDQSQSESKRVQSLWANKNPIIKKATWETVCDPQARFYRREMTKLIADNILAASAKRSNYDFWLNTLINNSCDSDPEVRFAAIQTCAKLLKANIPRSVELMLVTEKPSLTNGPTTQSSRGPKQIPVREAYDREFERFLMRMFLERHPQVVAQFLDSEAAAKRPVEARVLASLALEPKASAGRVAKLLPQLDRVPNEEELLRLAQFPDEPGVGGALKALLGNPTSRVAVLEKLLAQRTKLDTQKIAPILNETAREMLRNTDPAAQQQAMALISGFQLTELEGDLVALLKGPSAKPPVLQALRDLHSAESGLFATLVKSEADGAVKDAALEALAASRAPDAGSRFLELYPDLKPGPRKAALNTLASTKTGAKAIVSALLDKRLPQSDLDGQTTERLATVLEGDPDLDRLQQQLGGLFREVLLLDGQDTAWVDSKITLEGPFTVECWVRLTPNIGNGDSILGSPGKLDLNFFQSKLRVWIGEQGLHDVCVSTKPMTPDLWTHVAVTRDEKGVFRLYQNGELDATGTKTYAAKIEDCRIGWSEPKTGTEGALCEFRVWKKARTAAEIRAGFDRSGLTDGMDLMKLGKGARLAKTLDTPPLLTEEQAKALDQKFVKLTKLAAQGKAENGKAFSALCMACHQIGSAGGQIGPNLSGVGAMGLEAVLRNILTPNAAMEPGYRIYRVEMKNGDLIDAFFVSEDKDATVIRQPGLPDRRLDKKDVRSTKFIRRSLMPEGLLDALPDQQAADLLAYLMTLKG